MEKIKIGDRVSWWCLSTLIGTVTYIYLTDYPFYVVWDNGKDDWYKGSQLRKVK